MNKIAPLQKLALMTNDNFYIDFKHALVLEPQNKDAVDAEKRLRKLMAWSHAQQPLLEARSMKLIRRPKSVLDIPKMIQFLVSS